VKRHFVIEADGAADFPAPPRDRQRDHWFTVAGLTVLRFENREILDNTAHVIERIRLRAPCVSLSLARMAGLTRVMQHCSTKRVQAPAPSPSKEGPG
jgi:hypothetical protein